MVPFWTAAVDDGALLASGARDAPARGLRRPFHSSSTGHSSDGLLPAYRLWSADYQTTTSWTSLGSMYLALLRRADPPAARVELDRMGALIERDGTFWEVIDVPGRPWRSRSGLSVSDVSMLWGAILLEALEAGARRDRVVGLDEPVGSKTRPLQGAAVSVRRGPPEAVEGGLVVDEVGEQVLTGSDVTGRACDHLRVRGPLPRGSSQRGRWPCGERGVAAGAERWRTTVIWRFGG